MEVLKPSFNINPVIRGSSPDIRFKLLSSIQDNTPLTIEEETSVQFRVYRGSIGEDTLVLKKEVWIQDYEGNILIQLTALDTLNLSSGFYLFEIQINNPSTREYPASILKFYGNLSLI